MKLLGISLAWCAVIITSFAQPGSYSPQYIADRQTAFWFKRAFPFDTISIHAIRQATQVLRQWSLKTPATAQGYRWVPVGPFTVAGRTISVVVDPNDHQQWYVGTAAGGVWATSDAGKSWIQLPTSGLPVYAIGALALVGDTLFAGTGEPNFAYRNYPGDGIYWILRSDLQRGWRKLSESVGGTIAVIANQKTSTTRNHPTGLYQRISHSTFARILSGTVTDFATHPLNPQLIVAVIGEPFGSPQNGVYKTTDGGKTWKKIQQGVPSDFGRAEIAWDAGGNALYLLVANTQGGWGGLYRSLDQGESFQSIPTAPSQLFGHNIASGQGWYDITLGISPYDSQQIWIGGVWLYRSTDGGISWRKIADLHVDQHNLAFISRDSILVVNDGGVYLIVDTVALYRSTGLLSTQFYDIDLHPLQPIVLGGTQDNGAFLLTQNGWRQIIQGDVTRCIIHSQNPDLFLLNTPYGYLYRTTSQGQQWQFSGAGIDYNEVRFWETPLIQSHKKPRVFYTATSRVYRSTDDGVRWVPISPPLGGSNIPIVELSEYDTQTFAAATLDGRVFLTRSGGLRWSEITGDSLPRRFPATIAFHPATDRIMVVGYSGYGTKHLWLTRNRGFSWHSIDGNLPDIPVNVFRFDPYRPDSQWYVGTDFGIFYTADAGKHWQPLYNGIGIAPVTDIVIDTVRREILIATYGMGIWKVGRDAVPVELELFEAQQVSPLTVELFWKMQVQDEVERFRITRLCRELPATVIGELPPIPAGLYTIRDSVGSLALRCDTLQYRLEAILADGTLKVLGNRTIVLRLESYDLSLVRAQWKGEQLLVHYRLPKRTAASLDLVTLDGRTMPLLYHPSHPGGNFVLTFPLQSDQYAQGIFFVRLRTPSRQVVLRVQKF